MWVCSVNSAPCMVSMEPSVLGTTISLAGQGQENHQDIIPLIPLAAREKLRLKKLNHTRTVPHPYAFYINA